MSKKFYKFLSEQIENYFVGKDLKPGDRFYIQFNQKEQVKKLYNALKERDCAYSFNLPLEEENDSYSSYLIRVDDQEIIIAATTNNVHSHFLTYLRNRVGKKTHSKLRDKIILFIDHTDLDSIKDAESFYKEGMPFHLEVVKKEIKEQMKEKELSKADQKIIEFTLLKRRDNLLEDYSSLFSYQDIIEVIYKGGISKEKYSDFEIFPDETLDTYNEKAMKKRLEDNNKLFRKVSQIYEYKDVAIEDELEKTFDDDGVDLLSKGEWGKVSYSEVKESRDNKKKASPIKYLKKEELTTKKGLKCWERIKKKDSHIIVFNPKKNKEINLEFKFDRLIKEKPEYKPEDNISSCRRNNDKNKLNVKIDHKVNQTTFAIIKIKHKGSKRHQLRIAVVECNETVLQDIKTNYSLTARQNNNKIKIKSNEGIVINSNEDSSKEIIIDQKDFEAKINNPNYKTIIKNDLSKLNEVEKINIDLNYLDTSMPLTIIQEIEKPKFVSGLNVWKFKREKQKNFEYNSETEKLIQGNQEYFTKTPFRDNLNLEYEIIKSGALFYSQSYKEDDLKEQSLQIDNIVEESYKNLIEYYKKNKLLPSLAHYNEQLIELSKKYINSYLQAINEIKTGDALETCKRNLMKIGTIERGVSEKEIIFTPLHPLNVAYQVVLNEEIGKEKISNKILERLSPISLLPYIEKEKGEICKPIGQCDSPEWTYYTNARKNNNNNSREFIVKLVNEKLTEFTNHFSYLFTLKKASIKIGLINMGNCSEVLEAIWKYYKQQFKDNKIDKLIPVDIYIYDNNKTNEFSLYNEIEKVKERFKNQSNFDDYDESYILDIFRANVHVYFKNEFEDNYEYCHITFYEMKEDFEPTYRNMNNISTGISLNGLFSGVSSVYHENSYLTGFGTKCIKEDNKNILLKTAINLNSLARTANNMDPYEKEQCIVTTISNEKKQDLDKIYKNSRWVTFIEPKVDLSFFQDESDDDNVLIIHYSDQYTSSSGYDAITVTKRSNQYQEVINEFLTEKLETFENTCSKIINNFNAINGNWLLRLISNQNQFSREKISIISAIKVALAYFNHEEILWIPIALEEILRISAGTGLKLSEGLFNARKSGVYSDDLLLVGIEWKAEPIKIHYYPIEVKIGNCRSNVIKKAVNQVIKTKKLLDEYLIGDNFNNKFYRNFIMQFALASAKKMKLYKMYEEQKWDKIIDDHLREKLLNDKYEINNELNNYINDGAVISFKKNEYDRKVYESNQNNNVLILQFTENDGYENINTSVNKIEKLIRDGNMGFDVSKLLNNLY
ncbi:DNA phosphorothioation-dependent restriction protein DptH [Natroniella sulfidigena]|uniref:DNA phosphorothioation-dependent restriction protein DptH n=1 Tax=Natroniella sulfidigena TaxID=723921 RepID=UPI00200A8DAF|nr:DNA phosphorothioation-dependent restriction protein DptH [Natroniella sulfidigena]MCK8817151.1 DNA phosphorothioation-dependent restriction protein DptH [Natroniella sulfidigena]